MTPIHDSRFTTTEILQKYWGYSSFRQSQQEIINAVLHGSDVLALLPTGGGKSICYQVPALMKEGLCLVISPLIALMKDQVENLRKKNITAFAIYSGQSRKEVENILETASKSNCKFLYVSPERLETTLFKEYLPGLHINLIAVDEAHCISQWGYDFRPPYLRIAALRDEVKNIPVLALTASATAIVQTDICAKLSIDHNNNSWQIFKQPFERANLSYSSFKTDSKISKLREIISKVPGSSIIYCRSRIRTKEIAELLQLQGVAVHYYHAGLTQDERSRRQEDWISDKVRVIVCTNAFGMGIDKPDVRTVIHADVPESLENYYQEAGRAGRDAKKSYAVLLYNEKDINDLEANLVLRFPSVSYIKNVYQAVVNYLQIPLDASWGDYYDFNFTDFIKKFKLASQPCLFALKALEQDGWLNFAENFFAQSTAGFTSTKDYLFQFQKNHPTLELLIKTLLRIYEGIFDREVPISEKQIAGVSKQNIQEVENSLSVLHRAGVIQYQAQKELPQLCLQRERVKADDLRIDMAAFERRKKNYQQQLKQIIHFAKNEKECRSKIIAIYFGDSTATDCSICDNCLNKKTLPLNKEEFDKLGNKINALLQQKAFTVNELLLQFSGADKERVRKLITFYQTENKWELTAAGQIRLK